MSALLAPLWFLLSTFSLAPLALSFWKEKVRESVGVVVGWVYTVEEKLWGFLINGD